MGGELFTGISQGFMPAYQESLKAALDAPLRQAQVNYYNQRSDSGQQKNNFLYGTPPPKDTMNPNYDDAVSKYVSNMSNPPINIAPSGMEPGVKAALPTLMPKAASVASVPAEPDPNAPTSPASGNTNPLTRAAQERIAIKKAADADALAKQQQAQQAKAGMVGNEKPFKPDVTTGRIISGAPAFGKMSDDYINLKNTFQQTNSDPNTLGSFVKSKLLSMSPETSNAFATVFGGDFAQRNYAEQLRMLKSFEFAQQVSGSTRPPSPEIVKEIYSQTPSIQETPTQFAAKMRTLQEQIGERIGGTAQLADLGNQPNAAAKLRAMSKNFYSSRAKVGGVNYTPEGSPIIQELGLNPQGVAATAGYSHLWGE